MYEIEELIADEIAPLPYEPEVTFDPETSAVLERVSEDEQAKSQVGMPCVEPSARRLTPRLEGLGSGLRMTAYWVNSDFSREEALQTEGNSISSGERELLVRLTAIAKEVGFKFRVNVGKLFSVIWI